MSSNQSSVTLGDQTIILDLSSLKNKSVVITGGTSGLGKAYVKAFSDAGAFVTFCGSNQGKGEQVARGLPNVQFVKCDVRSWDEQAAVFEAAVSKSPRKSCDIVIANAGVATSPETSSTATINDAPVKPDTSVYDINIFGTYYTAMLAYHYFHKQPTSDKCLILQGSVVSYRATSNNFTYGSSKFAVRGLFTNLRQNALSEGIRVNMSAPGYVRTNIFSEERFDEIESSGIELAAMKDAVDCVLLFATKSDFAGRVVTVLSRKYAAGGLEEIKDDDHALEALYAKFATAKST